MGKTDGKILAALIRGERAQIATRLQWRRDTLDKHLGALRERVVYENTSQMLRDFSVLGSTSRDGNSGA